MRRLLKFVYKSLPFKKEIFSFVRLFYSPPESIYKHLYFKGVFKVTVAHGKKFKIYHHGYVVENEIFWGGLEGGWEKKSIALWIKLCEHANTILDIGANSGVYGLVAKTVNTNAKVYCFEPIPRVYQVLEQNIALNKYDIHSYQLALSDHSGKAKIYLPKNHDFEYSVTVNKNNSGDKNADEIEINVSDLESFIKNNNVTGIDLMKIDVETHEVEVLKGMGAYLRKFKPAMIIEILENDKAEKLNDLLGQMGYLYYDIDDAKGTIKKVTKLAKSSYFNYLICSPETASRIGI